MNEFAYNFFVSFDGWLNANHYAIMFFVFCFIAVCLIACFGALAVLPISKVSPNIEKISPRDEEKYRRRRERYDRFRTK